MSIYAGCFFCNKAGLGIPEDVIFLMTVLSRAGCWLRCGRHQDQGGEEGRQLGHQRPEDVDHQRWGGQFLLCPGAHQP